MNVSGGSEASMPVNSGAVLLGALRRWGARGTARAWAAVLLVAALALGAFAPAAHAQEVLPVPALDARVVDQTGTLGAGREALVAKLEEIERSTGSQIVILMVPTTQPEDIASYAYRVAAAWKIGRRDVGDGILVVVAKDDRHVRIEVAKALEGAVPDLAAYQIIDRALKPAFKAGDYVGGLSAGVDQLAARIRGEALPPPEVRGGTNGGVPGPGHARHGGKGQFNILFVLFGVVVAASVLKAMLGRTLGSLATGAGAGGLAWLFGSGLALAGVAGVVALVASALMGRGRVAGLGARGGRRGNGVLWAGGLGGGLGGLGGGGFGGFGGGGFGGGGGGGFSSGGGGDFGGGGASGNW
jgi:uncharacterized protein